MTGPKRPHFAITFSATALTYLHANHLGTPIRGTHGLGDPDGDPDGDPNTGPTDRPGDIVFDDFRSPFGLLPDPGWGGAVVASGYSSTTGTGPNCGVTGFTTHVRDCETNLTYMQARYYSADIARFGSVDPVRFLDTGNPGMFNRYAYTFNDPINLTDPDGRCPGAPMSCPTRSMGGVSQANYQAYADGVGQAIPGAGVIAAVQAGSGPVGIGIAVASEAPVAKPLKIKRAAQLAKNRAQGKKGEALTRKKLGDDVAGEQVTLESSQGTRARVDFVKQDGGIVETKTGNGQLSKGQQDVFDDINSGTPVTPRGQNAADAGIEVNQPVRLPSCSVDRPC